MVPKLVKEPQVKREPVCFRSNWSNFENHRAKRPPRKMAPIPRMIKPKVNRNLNIYFFFKAFIPFFNGWTTTDWELVASYLCQLQIDPSAILSGMVPGLTRYPLEQTCRPH